MNVMEIVNEFFRFDRELPVYRWDERAEQYYPIRELRLNTVFVYDKHGNPSEIEVVEVR
jgi:hypothetical protein